MFNSTTSVVIMITIIRMNIVPTLKHIRLLKGVIHLTPFSKSVMSEIKKKLSWNFVTITNKIALL